MSKRLYVGNLSWSTTDDSLKESMERFGEVTDSRIITDRETGRSRGFGFVTFAAGDSADSAISEMDGKELDGRTIRVNVAHERPQRGGGGGGERRERW